MPFLIKYEMKVNPNNQRNRIKIINIVRKWEFFILLTCLQYFKYFRKGSTSFYLFTNLSFYLYEPLTLSLSSSFIQQAYCRMCSTVEEFLGAFLWYLAYTGQLGQAIRLTAISPINLHSSEHFWKAQIAQYLWDIFFH